MINQDEFLKDPQKYLQVAENAVVTVSTEYGGAVILNLEEYEEYNADRIVCERIRTHSPEKALSYDAVFSRLRTRAISKQV